MEILDRQTDYDLEWVEREAEDEHFDGDLSDLVMERCRFTRCSFHGVRLSDARIAGSTFDTCDFTAARLDGATLSRSGFLNCTFRLARLFGATFDECKMTGSGFEEADLAAIKVDGGDWSFTDLSGRMLTSLDLKGVRFADANFAFADLRKSTLRDARSQSCPDRRRQPRRGRPPWGDARRGRPDPDRADGRPTGPWPGNPRGRGAGWPCRLTGGPLRTGSRSRRPGWTDSARSPGGRTQDSLTASPHSTPVEIGIIARAIHAGRSERVA